MRRTALTLFLLLVIVFGYVPQRLLASPRLPNVSPEMEKPGFWVKKIENPTRPLMTPEMIDKMNEENLTRPDLRLCRIKNLKEDCSREEILSFLKEDWESFGRNHEAQYGKNGVRLGDSFWNRLKGNLNQESLPQRNPTFFALIINRTDIRVFPTEEPSFSTPNKDAFDRFQHSSISVGSPVGIYCFSHDRKWAYTQTPFIRGWIRMRDLAVANARAEVVDYEGMKNRLVVTGNSVTVFSDPSFRQQAFIAQMGDSFPPLHASDGGKGAYGFHVILIPSNKDGELLSFRKGYLRAEEDVYQGFLPYTQENVARQAFKMLHHLYGWGDRLGGRDCSRFIMDLFRTFGILMPRNSREQAWVGKDLGPAEGKSAQEKRKILDQSIPLATTLRLPGHIMLYLGRDKGNHYVIHSLWGIQKSGKGRPTLDKIGRAVVSDLTLGDKGPNGSLLDRITDIRVIGSNPEIQEK